MGALVTTSAVGASYALGSSPFAALPPAVVEAAAEMPVPGLCVPSEHTVSGAVDAAALVGDTVAIAVLDRATGTYTSSANDTTPFLSASLSKLLIADDYLHRAANPAQATLGADSDAEVRAAITEMLGASNDFIADQFWALGGGPEVIARTAERYGLEGTAATGWEWWNTLVTARDVATYLDKLLSGEGGLGSRDRALIVSALRGATPLGADGFDQRMGVWDTLDHLRNAGAKYGWMTLGYSTIRHSVGFAGPGSRYVVVALGQLAGGSPSTVADIYNTAASDRLTTVVDDALATALTDDVAACRVTP